MTNYEKIKAMSVEEMAEELAYIAGCGGDPSGCFHCLLKGSGKCYKTEYIAGWLEREAEE